jgi:voltage-gated potassium channel
MAGVIAWAKPKFAPEVLRLGAIRSAILVMRLMTALIGLHLLEILLWAGFYRWLCFTSWESAFYFSAASLRPLATAMSFFRGLGGLWVHWKASLAC